MKLHVGVDIVRRSYHQTTRARAQNVGKLENFMI